MGRKRRRAMVGASSVSSRYGGKSRRVLVHARVIRRSSGINAARVVDRPCDDGRSAS